MAETRDELIIRRTAEGKPAKAIAAELGVGHWVVDKARRRLGLKVRAARKGRHKPNPANYVRLAPDVSLLPDWEYLTDG